MKTYRRAERWGGYVRITEVDDAGAWRTWIEWPDGTTDDYHEDTLQGMGWDSLRDFLKARPGFKLVDGPLPYDIIIDDTHDAAYVPAQEVQGRDIPDDWEIGD